MGRPSAKQILPQFQLIRCGDIVPMSPDGKQGIWVKDFKLNEWILWWDNGKGDTSWTWGIYADGSHSARLVTRVRTYYRWNNAPGILFNLLIEFCDIIMMRKCMLGIKERAEFLYLSQVH